MRSFIVPGLSYPLWSLLTPVGTVDPTAAWLGLGLCFLAVPVIHAVRPLSRAVLQNTMSVLAGGVTLHMFVLASVNDMYPFYAVASSLAVLSTALFIRSIPLMIGYSAFVAVLGVSLYVADPDEKKIAYWGGMLPVLFLAYHRLSTQLAQHHELESRVRERTHQLSLANQRLLDEIEERARLENELRVTHKMEAIGRLAGGVAHDFNNVLTTIGVYAEIVLAGLPKDSSLRKEVRQIQDANRQAISLTQQLLTFGRRSHVQVERVDLNEVVGDGSTMLRHLLSAETELVIDLSDEPQPILGDLDQLQQILINLTINARDAMSGPGRFTIATSRCRVEELEAQKVAVPAGTTEYVRLSVIDTGSGMSREARERAFDPFFTTKGPDAGSGLGLSIVHGVVSQADGFVRLESEPGRGTRLDLYWPLAPADAPSDASAARAPVRGGNEEVLLVEDEKALREALQRVLTTAGYRVTPAGDGESALEIASRSDADFALVVADVVMPHMSGFELAHRLRNSRPDTRILLISGHLSDRALEIVPAGISFLAKPFSADQLSEKVREVLDAPG